MNIARVTDPEIESRNAADRFRGRDRGAETARQREERERVIDKETKRERRAEAERQGKERE